MPRPSQIVIVVCSNCPTITACIQGRYADWSVLHEPAFADVSHSGQDHTAILIIRCCGVQHMAWTHASLQTILSFSYTVCLPQVSAV